MTVWFGKLGKFLGEYLGNRENVDEIKNHMATQFWIFLRNWGHFGNMWKNLKTWSCDLGKYGKFRKIGDDIKNHGKFFGIIGKFGGIGKVWGKIKNHGSDTVFHLFSQINQHGSYFIFSLLNMSVLQKHLLCFFPTFLVFFSFFVPFLLALYPSSFVPFSSFFFLS